MPSKRRAVIFALIGVALFLALFIPLTIAARSGVFAQIEWIDRLAGP